MYSIACMKEERIGRHKLVRIKADHSCFFSSDPYQLKSYVCLCILLEAKLTFPFRRGGIFRVLSCPNRPTACFYPTSP